MQTTVLVRSSSRPEPYAINVAVEHTRIFVFCDCPAGVLEQYCKHKEALVMGDERILFDETQRESFLRATEVIKSSELPSMIAERREADRAVEAAKKRVKSLKVRIARSMTEGIE